MESFYNLHSYKEKQSTIAKLNWKKGVYDSLRKREKRQCVRIGCEKIFETIHSDRKIFCSMECAARVNDEKRNVITHQRKEEIAKLYRDGLSMAEISESLGYGYGKTVYWMKKLNIQEDLIVRRITLSTTQTEILLRLRRLFLKKKQN